jgi:hypothetical protein
MKTYKQDLSAEPTASNEFVYIEKILSGMAAVLPETSHFCQVYNYLLYMNACLTAICSLCMLSPAPMRPWQRHTNIECCGLHCNNQQAFINKSNFGRLFSATKSKSERVCNALKELQRTGLYSKSYNGVSNYTFQPRLNTRKVVQNLRPVSQQNLKDSDGTTNLSWTLLCRFPVASVGPRWGHRAKWHLRSHKSDTVRRSSASYNYFDVTTDKRKTKMEKYLEHKTTC